MPRRRALQLDAAAHLDFTLPKGQDALSPGRYRLKDKIIRWADETGVDVTLHPSTHRASFADEDQAEAFKAQWGGQKLRI